TTDAPLTSARPLSYQLNFLGDNTVAKVSETTTYTRRECSPKPASGGRFEFLPLQQSAAPVPTPYQVLRGDFNGDGRDDLVWSHTVSGSAQVAVGFGQADATFDIAAAWTHPATPTEGWGNGYEVVVADVNGDGAADLVWNRRQNGESNAIYVALSNKDGTFTAGERIQHPVPNWQNGWRLHVGNMDGLVDGKKYDDLVWTHVSGSGHAIYIALSRGDGTFTFGPRQSTAGGGWSAYVARVGDVNADGWDDVVLNNSSGGNWVYVRRSNGDGTLTLLPDQEFGAIGWADYTLHTGDFNRDGRMDLLWNATARQNIPIHRGLGGADSRFLHLPFQSVPHPADTTALHTLIGDFNGDGGDDVLWNRRGVGLNHLYVGLSNVDAEFEFTPLDQEHPASASSEDWTAFEGGVLVLDVNGDGLDDVVWNERASTNRIYVARAKPAGLD
ncbi:MAG TPA: VCBS repeat-containing protein, partial [Longimicrobiales bacterium]|nr:VCBS repeat-containing protein [Longimicrobiales bacterium]